MNRLVSKICEAFQTGNAESIPVWRDSEQVCALADSERHLGHAVRCQQYWIAYDAIHPNRSGDGFRVIGNFSTIADAKAAVEQSLQIRWAWEAGASQEHASSPIDRVWKKLAGGGTPV